METIGITRIAKMLRTTKQRVHYYAKTGKLDAKNGNILLTEKSLELIKRLSVKLGSTDWENIEKRILNNARNYRRLESSNQIHKQLKMELKREKECNLEVNL
jgi:hypothetical protein